MKLRRIPENHTFSRTVTFLNGSEAAATPESARYRVDCLTTCEVVRGWTAITPAETVTLTFNQVDNAIQGYSDYERKQCVVESTDIVGNTRLNSFDWEVENLKGVK